MARKIDWTPPTLVLVSLFTAIHSGWRKVVYFSTDVNEKTGFPKYRAKMTRIRHNDYRFTIDRLNADEREFIKNARKRGMTYVGGTVCTVKAKLGTALLPKAKVSNGRKAKK